MTTQLFNKNYGRATNGPPHIQSMPSPFFLSVRENPPYLSLLTPVRVTSWLEMDHGKHKGQQFLDSYTKEWPFIERSHLGDNYVRCKTCNSYFLIQHSGKYDIGRHVKTSKHAKSSKCIQGVAKIETFVNPIARSDIAVTESVLCYIFITRVKNTN